MRHFLPLLILLLGGCAVGPDYTSPFINAPARWLGLSEGSHRTEGIVSPNEAWWQAFNDSILTNLMQRALLANGDLKIASARVAEARANRLSTTANLFPQIDTTGSFNRSTSTLTGKPLNSSLAGFQASWELDLFGGNRRTAEAARANLAAAGAARQAVQVGLLAEVARGYLTVRNLQQQVSLTTSNLEIQRQTEGIVKAQFNEGVVSRFDVSRATAQRATTEARVPVMEQSLSAARNSLSVLVGLTPQELTQQLATSSPTIPMATPQVLVGTPSTVLANRPDIRRTERLLAAATANEGVAIANWFPRISLASLFGLQNTTAGGPITAWNASGSVLMPLIDFGRIRAQVNFAHAAEKEAYATYEQAIRSALSDVETSLTGYVNAQRQFTSQKEAADNTTEATHLAQLRYKEGTSSLLDLLTAQAQQLTAESDLATAQANVGQSLSNLYAALGGGSEVSPSPTTLVSTTSILKE